MKKCSLNVHGSNHIMSENQREKIKLDKILY